MLARTKVSGRRIRLLGVKEECIFEVSQAIQKSSAEGRSPDGGKRTRKRV